MHHRDILVYIVTTPNCEPYPKVNPIDFGLPLASLEHGSPRSTFWEYHRLFIWCMKFDMLKYFGSPPGTNKTQQQSKIVNQ